MTNNTPRPLGVLDEFKSAGIFVNWWQQIRYDLKTIISIGWHHTLIPDAYLVAAFFQRKADAIEALEAEISETQGELAEVALEDGRLGGGVHDQDQGVGLEHGAGQLAHASKKRLPFCHADCPARIKDVEGM